jgi:hypothetical protein
MNAIRLRRRLLQGLKPPIFLSAFGTTKVVPFQETADPSVIFI